MIKKSIYLFAAMAAIVLSGCGKGSTEKIEYLPCQLSSGSGWGLIDSKGEVIMGGRFENEPSPVRGEMMSVKNGQYYQLYRVSEGAAALVADSLTAAGVPAYGRVPVCRADGTMAVLDKDGAEVFRFTEIEGQQVVSTAPMYELGMLEVETVNSLGLRHRALVDRDGKAVLPPHYKEILLLEDDLAWVMQETVDNSENDSSSTVRRTSYFVNMKGELQGDKPRSLDTREKVLQQYGPKTEGMTEKNGWMVEQVEGFGYVGSKELTMAVMDEKQWTAKGQTVSRISGLVKPKDFIANDTYIYDRVTNAVLRQLQTGLQSRGLTIPLTAPYITSILETPANDYNTFLTMQNYAWQESDVRCEAKAVFDTVIVRKHMVIEKTGVQNQYGEAVEMNKLKEDGYEYNPEADLVSIDLDCMIDSTLTQGVYERLREQLGTIYKEREGAYIDGEELISMKMSKGRISFHIERDPVVIAAEEEARQKAMQAAIDSAIAAQTDTTGTVKTDTITAE